MSSDSKIVTLRSFATNEFNNTTKPSGFSWWLKLYFERFLAFLLLLLLSPLLLLICVAISIDSPGPPIFFQSRFGRKARSFKVLKFRTMRADKADFAGGVQTKDTDPRITRVGFWLRRTSLDELPQLINVLKGDMNIIGPRAHPCGMRINGELCEDLAPNYHSRHMITPGITGWAQVNGSRGAVKTLDSLNRRIELDCEYIRDWSLKKDFEILMRTFRVLVHQGKGV